MLQPRHILDRLMEASGVSTQAELARHLEIAPQRIAEAIHRGKIPALWIFRTAYDTGFRAEWLETGRGAKLHSARTTVAAEALADYGLPQAAIVPVLTWVQAGALRAAEDLYPYAGAADDYIVVAARGVHTFALRVRGDSMLPDFREGDTIIIDPDLAPQPGDFVVAVADGPSEATFKRYLRKKDGDVLAPLNPDYAPIVLQPGHRIVGKVVRLVRNY